jgi:hypothetical protein
MRQMLLAWHITCNTSAMAHAHDQSNQFCAPLENGSPTRRELWRWSPHRIGPRFAWLDHNHILVVDGPLSERRFEVTTDLQPGTAVVRLREDGLFAGMVRVERSPSGKDAILSSAAVGLRFRRCGLAAIMTWCVFRELLTRQDVATFRIRMMRSVKTRAADAEVGGVGVGVIAARLGFRPELPVKRLLSEDNVVSIAALPGDKDSPPSIRISLRNHPFVLVAVALSPDTMRPFSDIRPYQQLDRDVSQIQNWMREGLLLVGGDYNLGQSGIERFVNALATDEDEAAQFRNKIRPL